MASMGYVPRDKLPPAVRRLRRGAPHSSVYSPGISMPLKTQPDKISEVKQFFPCPLSAFCFLIVQAYLCAQLGSEGSDSYQALARAKGILPGIPNKQNNNYLTTSLM